jgi:hypothetical protein
MEEISDLLDICPLDACEELTCRTLTSIPFPPFWARGSRVVLKTAVIFVAEYGNAA